MKFIFITLFVLNKDKSIDCNEWQSQNILLILLTLFVLNENNSIDCNQ